MFAEPAPANAARHCQGRNGLIDRCHGLVSHRAGHRTRLRTPPPAHLAIRTLMVPEVVGSMFRLGREPPLATTASGFKTDITSCAPWTSLLGDYARTGNADMIYLAEQFPDPAKFSLCSPKSFPLICSGNYAKSHCSAVVSSYEMGSWSLKIAKFPVLWRKHHGCDQHCVASQAFARYAWLPRRRENAPEIQTTACARLGGETSDCLGCVKALWRRDRAAELDSSLGCSGTKSGYYTTQSYKKIQQIEWGVMSVVTRTYAQFLTDTKPYAPQDIVTIADSAATLQALSVGQIAQFGAANVDIIDSLDDP
jgi:hypothetical protein